MPIFLILNPCVFNICKVGGSSETEGRDGTLGLGVDGQVMIWCCSSNCGLSTSLYLEDIGRNANELKRI